MAAVLRSAGHGRDGLVLTRRRAVLNSDLPARAPSQRGAALPTDENRAMCRGPTPARPLRRRRRLPPAHPGEQHAEVLLNTPLWRSLVLDDQDDNRPAQV